MNLTRRKFFKWLGFATVSPSLLAEMPVADKLIHYNDRVIISQARGTGRVEPIFTTADNRIGEVWARTLWEESKRNPLFKGEVGVWQGFTIHCDI